MTTIESPISQQAADFLADLGTDPLKGAHQFSPRVRRGLATSHDTRQAMLHPELFRRLHSGELVLDPDDPRSTPSTDIASGQLKWFPNIDAALDYLNSLEGSAE